MFVLHLVSVPLASISEEPKDRSSSVGKLLLNCDDKQPNAFILFIHLFTKDNQEVLDIKVYHSKYRGCIHFCYGAMFMTRSLRATFPSTSTMQKRCI